MTYFVHLQGIGKTTAKYSKDIRIGDILVWNFGYTSEVIDLRFTKSGKTIIATLKTVSEYTKVSNITDRQLRCNSLVAFKEEVLIGYNKLNKFK
jgi:hypothetical protein